MEHSPDYTQHYETPVQGDATVPDILIFGCACGVEDCTWQVEIGRKTFFPTTCR